MSKNQPGYERLRYEVITQETEDGDLLIPLPEPLLKHLGIKEGDEVDIDIDEKTGSIYIKKK